MREAILLPIADSSQVGEARRHAVAIAASLGFNYTDRGKVGIIVTEAANNLVQHVGNGLLLLQALDHDHHTGIEILALDQGRGMENISECLRDGFSTAGTSGNGLGAIRRLSTVFEIHSLLNVGTALLSQLWVKAAPSHLEYPTLQINGICLPIAGEEVSGDAWANGQHSRQTLVLVADGLGHGVLAAQASSTAIRVFREQIHRSPKEIIEFAHAALRSTRGAAIAIAAIDPDRQVIRFAGVGNISGTVISPQRRSSMVSYNGTVGHELRKVQEFTYPWEPDSLLIMHSDGLATQWQLERYPGLAIKHPSLIAGVLFRDFNRGRDDVTVLVARETEV